MVFNYIRRCTKYLIGKSKIIRLDEKAKSTYVLLTRDILNERTIHITKTKNIYYEKGSFQ